ACGSGSSDVTFERGTPANTFSTRPTGRFTFVLDPRYLPMLSTTDLSGVIPFVRDLRRIDPPITITFAFPRYLESKGPACTEEQCPVFWEIVRPNSVPDILLSKRMP